MWIVQLTWSDVHVATGEVCRRTAEVDWDQTTGTWYSSLQDWLETRWAPSTDQTQCLVSLCLEIHIQSCTTFQGRNHVFKVRGSNSLDPLPITTLLQKILDRSTQFGFVGYIITLYSSKSYVNSWGSVQILGRSVRTPWPSSGCAHATFYWSSKHQVSK